MTTCGVHQTRSSVHEPSQNTRSPVQAAMPGNGSCHAAGRCSDRRNLMTEVRSRMAKGAAWMVLLRLSDRSIGLVSTMFLARLLVPADFGLVAMAMSVVAALEIMSTFSFDLALIQNRSVD